MGVQALQAINSTIRSNHCNISSIISSILPTTLTSSAFNEEDRNVIEGYLGRKLNDIAVKYEPLLKNLDEENDSLNVRMEMSVLALKIMLDRLVNAATSAEKLSSPNLSSLIESASSVAQLVADLSMTNNPILASCAINKTSPSPNVIPKAVAKIDPTPLIFTSQQFDETAMNKANNGKVSRPNNLILQGSQAFLHRGHPIIIRFGLCVVENTSIIFMVCFPEISEKKLNSEGYNDENPYFGDFEMSIKFLNEKGIPVISKDIFVEAWHGTCIFLPTATNSDHLRCRDSTYFDEEFIPIGDNWEQRALFDSCILKCDDGSVKGRIDKSLVSYFINTEVKIVNVPAQGQGQNQSGLEKNQDQELMTAVTLEASDCKPAANDSVDSSGIIDDRGDEIENAENFDNVENAENFGNVENDKNFENVENDKNFENVENAENAYNANYVENAYNANYVENADNVNTIHEDKYSIMNKIETKLSSEGLKAFQSWATKEENANALWKLDETVNVELLHFGYKYKIPGLVKDASGNLCKLVTCPELGNQLTKELALEILAAAAMYGLECVSEEMVKVVADFILDPK